MYDSPTIAARSMRQCRNGILAASVFMTSMVNPLLAIRISDGTYALSFTIFSQAATMKWTSTPSKPKSEMARAAPRTAAAPGRCMREDKKASSSLEQCFVSCKKSFEISIPHEATQEKGPSLKQLLNKSSSPLLVTYLRNQTLYDNHRHSNSIG